MYVWAQEWRFQFIYCIYRVSNLHIQTPHWPYWVIIIGLRPVPIMGFRSNSKPDQILKCSSLKFDQAIINRNCTFTTVLLLWRVQMLWSAGYFMDKSFTYFHWISNSIEISLIRWVPGAAWKACSCHEAIMPMLHAVYMIHNDMNHYLISNNSTIIYPPYTTTTYIHDYHYMDTVRIYTSPNINFAVLSCK